MVIAALAAVLTGDIHLFWREYDANPAGVPAAMMAKASPEWRRYLAVAGHPENFMWALKSYPRFYKSIRAETSRIASEAGQVEAAVAAWRTRYPAAREVPVALGVDRVNRGGQATRQGVYLAVEFYARTPETDLSELTPWHQSVIVGRDGLAPAVVHELAHVEQVESSEPTLLVACLREGAADFLAELVTGRSTKPDLARWCAPRGRELFREFARRPNRVSYQGWLYDGSEAKGDRPADTGYWIGSEIARAYYDRMPDKAEAIAELAELRDPFTVIWKAGYGWLTRPPTAKPRSGGRWWK